MRVKRGQVKKQKHKKVLKQAKGYRMTYSKLYRRAKEAVGHAGAYSLAGRRHRRSQMREEWIKSISAGLVGTDYSYSKFINALNKNKIELDRKNLAYIATNHPEHFKEIVDGLK